MALYSYYAIMNMLREKDILRKISVRELLLELSKVYLVTDGKREIITEIPNKVEKLTEKLGLDIFPR